MLLKSFMCSAVFDTFQMNHMGINSKGKYPISIDSEVYLQDELLRLF